MTPDALGEAMQVISELTLLRTSGKIKKVINHFLEARFGIFFCPTLP